MPSVNMYDTFQKTRIAGATLGAYIRVKLDTSANVVAAGATDLGCGFLTERGSTSGEPTAVRGNKAPEYGAVASKAIAVGDIVYADASGKVTDTDGGSYVVLGVAITAAAADGDFVTIEPTV